jgi:hypothetical protein
MVCLCSLFLNATFVHGKTTAKIGFAVDFGSIRQPPLPDHTLDACYSVWHVCVLFGSVVLVSATASQPDPTL